MNERVRHLLERFPERAELIRALGESHARFKDLISEHHDVCEEISRMAQGDRESQAGRMDDLERRRANLEEELLLLMEDQQRP
jgi:uncharacterized protein YdcH (DUF465 family)